MLTLASFRKSVKVRNKKEIAESIEDARIWASDMSPVNGGINHYEKINMKSLNQQYESIKNMQLQVMKYFLAFIFFFSAFLTSKPLII